MPRTRSLAWSELKIGIVTVVRALPGGDADFPARRRHGVLLAALSPQDHLRQHRRAQGGRAGPRGRRRGRLGERDQLRRRPGGSHAGSRKTRTADASRRGSRASLGSVSLLGESAVDITASSQGTPIPEWGYVPSAPANGSIAEVATQATESIEEATALAQGHPRGPRHGGEALHRRRGLPRRGRVAVSAERVASQIASGRGTLGQVDQRSEAAITRSMAAVSDLNAITTQDSERRGQPGQAPQRSRAGQFAHLDHAEPRRDHRPD